MKTFLFLAAIMLSGCSYQGEDDDLRTVPVTNNPRIVPNHGMMPGMGPGVGGL